MCNNVILCATRFTNKTYDENKSYKQQKNFTGCLYGSPVKDGWIKIKKDKNGFISKTYGKGNNSLQVERDNENRNIDEIFRNLVIRHNNYKILDQETYFTNYKYSWESDSDNESISDGYSEFDNNDEDYYEDDEEFNADY